MGPKPLPIGVQNFAELRKEDYYYVDKTELIIDILDSKAKASLFTRPRRFGKSLNLSMLDAFFNYEFKGNTWFDGLHVSGRPDLNPHKNAYPVIFVDLKGLNGGTYDSFIELFRDRIGELYRAHMELADSERLLDVQIEEFRAFCSGHPNEMILSRSLVKLSNMLRIHHGKNVVILIDEYDDPANNARDDETRRAILDFLRLFLSPALKGNDSLKFAVVTGIMQISKESIFSGLNNLSVNNIFSRDYDEMFGFTDSEVRTLCSEYGHPEKFGEAMEWYNGYRFGDAEVYNP